MAQKKQYKAETRRLLDLMIHSIYTHKEIFLRELISNASDALDKIFHASLHGEVEIDRTALKIHISVDHTARTLTISDNGIGMTAAEMEDNLGVIAKSGSFTFKQALAKDEVPQNDIDIIGQFGVGFYSAFMVADKVEVFSQSAKGGDSVRFESAGEDGYRIETAEKLPVGTRIVLHLKSR
jgi:molecular chaperone HtpG